MDTISWRMLRRSTALLVLSIAMLLSGCGPLGSAEPTAVPTPTPTPAEIAAQIGRATQEAPSLHFAIELSGAPVYADTSGLFAISTMQGDLQRPDAVLALLNVRSFGGVIELRTVSLEGQQYLTNPITRQWECLQGGAVFDPAVLFDPQRGVEYLLQNEFENVTLAGTEQVDGREQYHLEGTVEGAALMEISANTLGRGTVEVDLWADLETQRATRIVLVDTGTDPEDPSTWTFTFSDYGKEVDVRPPTEC